VADIWVNGFCGPGARFAGLRVAVGACGVDGRGVDVGDVADLLGSDRHRMITPWVRDVVDVDFDNVRDGKEYVPGEKGECTISDTDGGVRT